MTKPKHLNMDIDNETTEDLVEVEEVVEEQEEQPEEEVVEKQQESLEDKESRLERQLSQTRKKLGKDAPKQEKQSNELGLDVKGYLKASGIKASEFDFVQAELKASGEDIDTLLENDYFQAKLEKQRELNTTADATPAGKGSTGVATESVDYWKGKDDSEIQSKAPKGMMIQVVNARIAEEKNKGKFYNS